MKEQYLEISSCTMIIFMSCASFYASQQIRVSLVGQADKVTDTGAIMGREYDEERRVK